MDRVEMWTKRELNVVEAVADLTNLSIRFNLSVAIPLTIYRDVRTLSDIQEHSMSI